MPKEDYKRLVVSFTGPSGSGKTTLIEKLSKHLISQKYKVSIIKNDSKDKAQFDTKGKDSFRFFQTGANVVVTGSKKTSYFFHHSQEFEDIISNLKDFDYLFIEGHKSFNLPRIGIFRNNIDKDYLSFCNIIATDNTIDKSIIDLEVLDLNNILSITNWIDLNAIKVN
jgi:molybdopterin-guanine dinucleotide biosynthesis protein B